MQVKGNTRYWAATIFKVKATVTLTFGLLNPETIGVFYFITENILWWLKAKGQMVSTFLNGIVFYKVFFGVSLTHWAQKQKGICYWSEIKWSYDQQNNISLFIINALHNNNALGKFMSMPPYLKYFTKPCGRTAIIAYKIDLHCSKFSLHES